MKGRTSIGHLRALLSRVVAITVLLFVVPARADNVDQLIGQLEDDSDKIRLSATLNLTKLGDQRAIRGLAKRLSNDSSRSVRSTAASGLGSLVNAKTKPDDKKVAVAALQNAKNNDPDDAVKAQAERALDAIGVTNVSTPSGGGGIYVNVGAMNNDPKNPNPNPKHIPLMAKTASKTMAKVAPAMAQTWPGGLPSQAQLAAKGVSGFFIDGTLNEVVIATAGNSSKVTCKISMYIANFPQKTAFGFLNGKATVQASSSPSDIALAGEDCVTAVVEDLITNKIVPTIKAKAGP